MSRAYDLGVLITAFVAVLVFSIALIGQAYMHPEKKDKELIRKYFNNKYGLDIFDQKELKEGEYEVTVDPKKPIKKEEAKNGFLLPEFGHFFECAVCSR